VQFIVKNILDTYTEEIAKALRKYPEDISAISIFNIHDYELALLLELVYNKALYDSINHKKLINT
jgi:hypothetical protein